ncbi:hypothetical protein VQL36_11385 [Chengkuizengella sp. SCS-71B]|uniref:hypothetical protein n=1 Tax=Chengkuizengella sp. SCS-71B TaxID=3115290 RepID=UPI0032C213CC
MVDDELIAGVIEAQKEIGSGYIVSEPFERYKYSDWKNVRITFEEFKNEVLMKSAKYIENVLEINSRFKKSKRYLYLINLIDTVKNIN